MNELTLNQRPAWIFDLDGTLTVAVHDFAHMRSELGMAPQADILQTLASMPEPERSRLTIKLDQLEAYYAQRAQGAQGVKSLINHLVQRKVRLGIFTRNTKEMALLSLKAIGVSQHFCDDDIIGRDEAPHKPNPSGLHMLLDNWQLEPSQAVMVGDFRYDLETGRAAGTATVHIATDERRWPELTDFCYPNLTMLCSELKG